jgi:CheY-like chemotaxis protein
MTLPPSVLVVDDDDMIRGLLATVLRRHGVGCEFAIDGEEAIERLREKRYALVLLDLMMPRADGFAVIAFLRDSTIRTPVVVVTAAGPHKTVNLDPTVVKAVLSKPFEIYHLIDTVTALCGVIEIDPLEERRPATPLPSV